MASNSTSSTSGRRYQAGAEITEGGVSFRVWAPGRQAIHLVLADGREHEMQAEEDGYFSLLMETAIAGDPYQFRIDGVEGLLADPASRLQPRGPEGPSVVVDPKKYAWKTADWDGIAPEGQVLYEMHVGTFTAEGTYAAAAEKLPHLKDVGITCIEMMPVNEFFGHFGWGYDGVLPYAPTRLYGSPDDLRAFIDAAHGHGIGVILDVVYNHFGQGERLKDFTPDYFAKSANDWGAAINFDGANAHGVRSFITENAAYWIDEFRFDGLRIDATQALIDTSERHILVDISEACRRAAGGRGILLVSENEPQETPMVRPIPSGGYGLDALWNDDFHHSAIAALTGRSEAYYHDHRGRAQEFVSAAKYGYLFQGQRYDWQDAPRGQPGLDLRPQNFVHFIQNHDQIANSGMGERIHKITSPGRLRAMTALLLLGPQTPMLFQGQEFAASSPFVYFADNSGKVAEDVRKGRTDFMAQFPSLDNQSFRDNMAEPSRLKTLQRVKLDWSEFEWHGEAVALHRDLLAMRREDKAFRKAGRGRLPLDGSVIDDKAFLLRYFGDAAEEDRLLIVNFGSDIRLSSLPDPLFAPPAACQWSILWSSEDLAYGGGGVRPIEPQSHWILTGESAVVLKPERAERRSPPDKETLTKWQARIG